MRVLFATSLSLLLLCACAGGPGYAPAGSTNYPVRPNPGSATPDPLARSATYVCEDLTTVVLQEGSAIARATLNSGLELGLARQPDALGFTYGDPSHQFRGRGGSATWHVGDKTFRCRAR